MRNSIKSEERDVPVVEGNGARISDTSSRRASPRAIKVRIVARFVTLRTGVKLQECAADARSSFTAAAVTQNAVDNTGTISERRSNLPPLSRHLAIPI